MSRDPPCRPAPDPPAAPTDLDVEALYAAHYRRLVGLAARRLDDIDEAEDVAQEALVRAYLALSRGTIIGQPAAWLTRVATNAAISRLRRRRTQGRLAARLGASGAPLGSATPEAADPAIIAEQVEAVAQVGHVLLGLRRRCRDDLLLWLYCADHVEAAARLGVPLPTWRARLWRAREALRLALALGRAGGREAATPLAARRGTVAALYSAGLPPAASARRLGLPRSVVGGDIAPARHRPAATAGLPDRAPSARPDG